MKFKAIIFDLDGTIIDTNHIWTQATHHLITSKGIDLTHEDKHDLSKELKGIAIPHSCAFLKEKYNLPHTLEELMLEKKSHADKLYKEGILFVDGFENFHQRALDHNLALGIATNAEKDTLATAIELLELKKFFKEHIYNFEQANNIPKPAPDVYLYAANQLNISPEHCLVIEDSAHGIEAANRAGMFCIGINTGKNKEALKEAKFIIEHYDEIDLQRLLGLKKSS